MLCFVIWARGCHALLCQKKTLQFSKCFVGDPIQCVYTYFHLWRFWLIRTLLGSKRVLFLSGHLESLNPFYLCAFVTLGLRSFVHFAIGSPTKHL